MTGEERTDGDDSPGRIAVFGGSFDPPHVAHVMAVAWALGAGAIDEVWVIPAFEHPLGKVAGAPFADRYEMTRLAMADLRRVRVLDLERRLGGGSRTLRTVETILRERPRARLRLLIGSDLLREAPRWHRWERIVALAPGMRDDIVAKGVPGSKVSVIPQGCDTELFNSADPSRVRAEHPWVGEGPMVLYAGTVGEANGLAYLIDLADHMRAVMPEVRFAIVGDGKERDALEARAASLGMKDKNIFFIGRVPKTVVVDWMAASQATLALLAGPRVMWKDAVQNKFFDSVAAGKPIVTNNGGWQTSIALEEGLGVTLSPDDLGLAAEQLSAMLRDEEFLGRVPANARRVAETRFNRDRQAREALRILEAAVASST